MPDFVEVVVSDRRISKWETVRTIKPTFRLYAKNSASRKIQDLMIKGGDFYAFWDDETKYWCTSEFILAERIDQLVWERYEEEKKKLEQSQEEHHVILEALTFQNCDSGVIDRWHKYVKGQARDNYKMLDSRIMFANSEGTAREDYATKTTDYVISDGATDGWDRIMSLYPEYAQAMIQWYFGAILAGESKTIQRMLIFYGAPGTGKSTVLRIAEKMFKRYWVPFTSKALADGSKDFSTEFLRQNPLVAIDHDGDLSRLSDNTLLNKIISHESVEVNEKNKPKYPMTPLVALMVASNKPVKITDSKSGILRRVLDVVPKGENSKIPRKEYDYIMNHQIDFELGAIANKCISVYRELGSTYYDTYIPLSMMAETNDFYNYIEMYYDDYSENDFVTLSQAWANYNTYCTLTDVKKKLSYREVRTELLNYFSEFRERMAVNNERMRNVFLHFKADKFMPKTDMEARGLNESGLISWLKFDNHTSIFDAVASDYPAQLADENGKPTRPWSEVNTKLSDIDTSKVHYVRVPKNHIVIDFDIKENGEKSFQKNLEAASKFPPTYAELSKSEAGIHLHYIYDGDVDKLSAVYSDNVEVKVFKGKSSLRRMLTRCNDIQMATLSSGLPLKENKKMIDKYVFKTDTELLNRITHIIKTGEPHGHTKPNMDFIKKLTDDAYNQGLIYDVECLRKSLHNYAMGSSNQKDVCLKLLSQMHLHSDEAPENVLLSGDKPKVFYDIEVFPNLLLINWKYPGEENQVVRMINPSPEELRAWVDENDLIGFNNRRYDNHIVYGRMTGMNNLELYSLSQKIINGAKDAFFRNAYNLSFTDIYDYTKDKKSLKKWEIELGIHHKELGLPWDKPVPEELWEKVAEYCDNDVIATEAVWNATQADFMAREIMAELSGLTVNDTTNQHTIKIVFGNNKTPQNEFVYTDLSKEFPTYKFENGRSEYRGEFIGEGGYVWYKPGIYFNVWVFDGASMHPHTIKRLNMFGDRYTKRYFDLVEARMAIKHEDYDMLSSIFEGKLMPYLKDKTLMKRLSDALKIVINSVYGLTSAKFDNAFKDPRNIDNICAKRGELFMMTLRDNLIEMGAEVVHIKTDSIKVVNPSEEIKNYIYKFGSDYGYTFEVENVYERFCLVNGSTYIAKHDNGEWEAKAAQFAQPYVFKTLFSKEEITFEDLCETKSVKSAMSLDMDENLPLNEHNYVFVGKVGLFCPMKDGVNAGRLVAERIDKKTGGIKYDAVTATKGYRWLEAETVKEKGLEDMIDRSYYIRLVDEAKEEISKYGDFEAFAA